MEQQKTTKKFSPAYKKHRSTHEIQSSENLNKLNNKQLFSPSKKWGPIGKLLLPNQTPKQMGTGNHNAPEKHSWHMLVRFTVGTGLSKDWDLITGLWNTPPSTHLNTTLLKMCLSQFLLLSPLCPPFKSYKAY